MIVKVSNNLYFSLCCSPDSATIYAKSRDSGEDVSTSRCHLSFAFHAHLWHNKLLPYEKKNAVPVQNAQCSHSASWRSGLHGACCKLSQGAYCKYSCVVPTTQQIIPFYEVAKLPLPIYKAADSYATKISCSCELIKPLSESPLIDIFKVLSSSQVQHSIFVSKRPL